MRLLSVSVGVLALMFVARGFAANVHVPPRSTPSASRHLLRAGSMGPTQIQRQSRRHAQV